MTVLRVKKATPFIISFCFFLLHLLPFQSALAQSDSMTYGQFADSSLRDEDSAIMAQNSKMFDSDRLDTTGKYFNWKENTTDAYSDERIKVRVSSDSTITRLRNDEDFWYVKSVEDFKKNAARLHYDKKYRDSLTKEGLMPPDEQVFTQEPDSNAWYAQAWFYYLIWTLIIGIFLSAVVYFLASNKINIFSRRAARSVVEEAGAEEGLQHINYDSLLQKYINEKNYRLAVRVLYLQLLKIMNEKEVIVFQPQFTNAHYLQQLYNTPLYNSFFVVTRHYEYIWYGEFAITEASFQKIQSDFGDIKNKVSYR